MVSKKNITIIAADDHPIMINGINDLLINAGYNVIGLANNGAKALELIAKYKPMIAIVDIEMPLLSGFEVIKRSTALSPKTKFIVMSYHKENGFLVQSKKCGALGYLLKEDNINEIESCIESVLLNKTYYGKSLNDNIENIVNNEIKKIRQLTPSERTILRLIYNGYSSRKMAEELSVSIRTVEKHRSNIINKLDIENKIDALNNWIINHKEILKSI